MVIFWFLWCTLFGALPAQAAEDYSLNIEGFRPSSDPFGYTVTESASTLKHLHMGVGMWWNHSDDSLVLLYEGQRVTGLIDGKDGVINQRDSVNLQVGIGISKYFSLSLDLPVVLWQEGFRPESVPLDQVDVDSSGLSDLRIAPKFVFLSTAESPVGIALVTRLMIPTAAKGTFFGEESFTFEPMAVIEVADGSVTSREYRFRMALNAGAMIRDRYTFRGLEINETFVYRVGLGFHPVKPLEIGVDAAGWIGGNLPEQRPLEILPWLKLLPAKRVTITAGAGLGLIPGLGAPDYRVFVGASLAPSVNPEDLDRDKDGVFNKYDLCPLEMEDMDGFEDDDGCLDEDNDEDKILDINDRCPMIPEDYDGVEDEDGCPDGDNDGDGIPDSEDRCPEEPETINGYLDEDGCPDTIPVGDSDGDGLDDKIDECPLQKEDFDLWKDEDGCPDRDNDLDGLLDAEDSCPNEKENFNGFEDEDGCPDDAPARVFIERSRIVIKEKIFFETNKSVIKEESFSLLNEIADLILENEDLRMIRVEGHTDGDGSDTYNLDLSQSRSESVVAYLVSRGVVQDRLDPAGFGERRPIADNETPEGKSQNRRVEFLIIDRD